MDLVPVKSKSAADDLIRDLERLEEEISPHSVIYSAEPTARTPAEQYEYNTDLMVRQLEVRKEALIKLQSALTAGLRKEHPVVMRLAEYFHIVICWR